MIHLDEPELMVLFKRNANRDLTFKLLDWTFTGNWSSRGRKTASPDKDLMASGEQRQNRTSGLT